MASSDKTSIGLNRWSETDKPKREDFNSDNEIISKEISSKEKAGACLKLPVGTTLQSDADTLTDWGMYYVANTANNAPTTNSAYLFIVWQWLNNSKYVYQFGYGATNKRLFVRSSSNGVFGAWSELFV